MAAETQGKTPAAENPLFKRALAVLGPLGDGIAANLNGDSGLVELIEEQNHLIIEGFALPADTYELLRDRSSTEFSRMGKNDAGAPIHCFGISSGNDVAFANFEEDEDDEFSRLSVDLLPAEAESPESWLRDTVRFNIASEIESLTAPLWRYSQVVGADDVLDMLREAAPA